MSALDLGQTMPLNVTQQAQHRIFVGLGWDPKEKAGLIEKARAMTGGKKDWHDLDLACFLYDQNQNFIGDVTHDPQKAVDESGKIYHSGDNKAGHGEGDDEEISVELKDLPTQIHHIVFVASIKTGHSFAEITSPYIRLVDGYSGYAFLDAPLHQEHSQNTSVFVFARIYREQEGWVMQNISAFTDFSDQGHWGESLKKYFA